MERGSASSGAATSFSPSGFTLAISFRAKARVTPNPSALVAALEKGGWDRVTRLYRRGDVPEEQCWLKRPDWCLTYD